MELNTSLQRTRVNVAFLVPFLTFLLHGTHGVTLLSAGEIERWVAITFASYPLFDDADASLVCLAGRAKRIGRSVHDDEPATENELRLVHVR